MSLRTLQHTGYIHVVLLTDLRVHADERPQTRSQSKRGAVKTCLPQRSDRLAPVRVRCTLFLRNSAGGMLRSRAAV